MSSKALLVLVALVGGLSCMRSPTHPCAPTSDRATISPVTGQAILNQFSIGDEVALAKERWNLERSTALKEGSAIDPPGSDLSAVRDVFQRLTAVAHRQHLPWKVHLIGDSTPRAAALGGGIVVIHSGLIDQLALREDEDALAMVLAHEIAHITLLHRVQRLTRYFGRLRVDDRTLEPRYHHIQRPSLQETEADRVAALYAALAGFDPVAGARVWEHALALYPPDTSPVHRKLVQERIAPASAAAALASQYRVPGTRNPRWEEILHTNDVVHQTVRLGDSRLSSSKPRCRSADSPPLEMANEGEASATEWGVELERTVVTVAPGDGRSKVQVLATVHNAFADPVDVGLVFSFVTLQGHTTHQVDYACHSTSPIPPGDSVTIRCELAGIPNFHHVTVAIGDITLR